MAQNSPRWTLPSRAPSAPAEPAPHCFGGIRTREPRFRRVLERAARYAASPLPLLILGESGSGKEVLARAVHDASPQKDGPFVAVNCGGIAPSLLESELFGHAKGAFTGAVQERTGALRAAHGGTLFLDELGEAPMNLQVALLRALETQRVRPVGSERECTIRVRIMAATSRPLGALMRSGAFRADLYHRLSGATLELPALRERECDLPLIAADLLAQLRPRTTLGEAACRLLQSRALPGNVRQLKSTLERALADAAPLPGSPYELSPPDFAPESSCDQELARQVLHASARAVSEVSSERASGQEVVTTFDAATPPSGVSVPPASVHGALATAADSALRPPPPLTPNERALAAALGHLARAADAYLASGLLLVPSHLTRRKARAYERALHLVLAERASTEQRALPAWFHARFGRLFRPGWDRADGGQAGRDVGRV